MRVVIADAMPARVAHIKQVVSRLGYRIVGVGGDGVWAVALCKKHAPDLAILADDLTALDTPHVVAALKRDGSAKYIILEQPAASKRDFSALLGDHTLPLGIPFTEAALHVAVRSMATVSAAAPDAGTSTTTTRLVPELPRRPWRSAAPSR